ncbi:MAG: prepilin peptidase, partial [Actinomycetota bacterium]|nr:prepilin peptidase [Actinomycetota bacterium]
NALLGGALAFAALFLIHLVSPAGMGFGDVRLSFILGLFLGWLSLSHVLVGIFLGFLLGALIGVALVVSRARSRKDAIPFGPFLAGGAALAVFAGSPIIHWWLHP